MQTGLPQMAREIKPSNIEITGGVDVPVSFISQLKAKLTGTLKKSTVTPKAIKRHTRGPVYFKCIPVVYDKEEGRMKIPKGVFAGKSVHRAVGDKDNKEYSETTLALESFENEDINLAAYLIDEDLKKLDIIKNVVLMSGEQSRGKRKERVKKYLTWFEEALTTGKKKLNLSDNKPLLPDDCDFLQNIYCPVPPGNQFLVDLSSFDTEKIQGYAIVLKLIDDLSDEQWDEVEKAWAEPEQD